MQASSPRGDAVDDRTRARMIRSAATLLQRRGYPGASVGDILAHAAAPRGSLYHHFPGGKRDLVVAAIELAADVFDVQLRTAAEVESFSDYLDALVALSSIDLIESEFEAACPVAAAALDVPQNEDAVVVASAEAFDRWAATIDAGFRKFVADPQRATTLATLATSALLGATMRARVARNVDEIARSMRAVASLA